MPDVFSPEKRRSIMAQVKSVNTKPELKVRRLLHALGHRFRLHRKDLPGKPDIVLPRHHKIIFVHGCFWHGHAGCRRATRPTSNVEFWQRKLDDDLQRDAQVVDQLTSTGWHVLVVWECETKNETALRELLMRFMQENEG